jgi:hypothetical protein
LRANRGRIVFDAKAEVRSAEIQSDAMSLNSTVQAAENHVELTIMALEGAAVTVDDIASH